MIHAVDLDFQVPHPSRVRDSPVRLYGVHFIKIHDLHLMMDKFSGRAQEPGGVQGVDFQSENQIPLFHFWLDRPEKSIDLPATAVLQPGEEVVNGVVTQRYTFGLDDLADSGTQYEAVKGTVWVAVDGDYVVKYESTITGEFDNLSAGSMDLMDQGTIVMSYEVSDVNGDFSIQPPTDAQGLDLGKLLSGLNF